MIDIIIPTYNNIDGLRKTLNSIPKNFLDRIAVTVIDDYSTTQYAQINEEYPFINFIRLDKNVGPGMARQRGIDSTRGEYIMFIDTGDYFLPNIFQPILDQLNSNPTLPLFVWKYLAGGKISKDKSNQLHGHIYQREFINKYNITFSKLGSYANEDIGFNYTCNLILQNFKLKYYFNQSPILFYDLNDGNSLTQKNNHEFIYKQQNINFAYNVIHSYNICKENNVDPQLLKTLAISGILSEYYWYLRAKFDRKEFLRDAWVGAKYYYDNLFKKYNNVEIPQVIVINRLLSHYGRDWKCPEKINVYNFIKILQLSI